jgi:hypothetical protein
MYDKTEVSFPVKKKLRVFISCTVFAMVFWTRNAKLMCVHSSSKIPAANIMQWGERKASYFKIRRPIVSNFGRRIIYIESRKKIP